MNYDDENSSLYDFDNIDDSDSSSSLEDESESSLDDENSDSLVDDESDSISENPESDSDVEEDSTSEDIQLIYELSDNSSELELLQSLNNKVEYISSLFIILFVFVLIFFVSRALNTFFQRI